MNKNIEEMETNEIVNYLKEKRYLHGIFYIDRDYMKENYNLTIKDDDWISFTEHMEYYFNEQNNFQFDGSQDFAIQEWIESN